MANADKLFEQIMEIRDQGLVNMLDVNGVQRVAFDNDMYELVWFIEEHKGEYWKFIMYGDKELLGAE